MVNFEHKNINKFTNMKNTIIYILLFVQLISFGFAQKAVYQLTGILTSDQSKDPVPFAKIQVVNARRATIANAVGFFSIPVIESDTLVLSSVGYFNLVISMKDFLTKYEGDKSEYYLYTVQTMKEDPITTPIVTILPYKNAQEGITQFLNIPLRVNDPMALAAQNLNKDLMGFYINNLPIDDNEKLQVAQQVFQEQYRNKNVMRTFPGNIIGLYKYIDYLNMKSKSKKGKNYDYWPD